MVEMRLGRRVYVLRTLLDVEARKLVVPEGLRLGHWKSLVLAVLRRTVTKIGSDITDSEVI